MVVDFQGILKSLKVSRWLSKKLQILQNHSHRSSSFLLIRRRSNPPWTRPLGRSCSCDWKSCQYFGVKPSPRFGTLRIMAIKFWDKVFLAKNHQKQKKYNQINTSTILIIKQIYKSTKSTDSLLQVPSLSFISKGSQKNISQKPLKVI